MELVGVRIKKIMEHLDLNFNSLGKELGYSDVVVGNIIKGRNKPSFDFINKLTQTFDWLNIVWVLTGNGEMILGNITSDPEAEYNIANSKINPKGIPLIPLDAMAGFGVGDTQVMDYETERYIVPEFDELNVEFMIRVKGSSMYPKYNSGDIVACKKLPLGTFFQWNKVYVLDTVQGPMIKRVKKSKLENHILIVSDNISYDPFDLHTDELYSLAIVVGVIRLE